ncbi:unnamed protein product [Acanthoscelides obtectus]|uniref:Uncharacterized protein n=1 Tax=Acanthoscelides obtectus TaxID=200917 RepID=A0A9P0KV85_ACAOB|nr:unnamed protein product [Acanthoscelides obtectus]CAK1645695.1 hypothetical protein AOBTE_LOCUS14214 [Acanthoscelides obtectus]
MSIHHGYLIDNHGSALWAYFAKSSDDNTLRTCGGHSYAGATLAGYGEYSGYGDVCGRVHRYNAVYSGEDDVTSGGCR